MQVIFMLKLISVFFLYIFATQTYTKLYTTTFPPCNTKQQIGIFRHKTILLKWIIWYHSF